MDAPAPPAAQRAPVGGPPAPAGAQPRHRAAQRGGRRGPYKRQLTLKEKVKAIAKIDAGASKSATAKALGLNESTIRTIYSQKEKILATVKAEEAVDRDVQEILDEALDFEGFTASQQ